MQIRMFVCVFVVRSFSSFAAVEVLWVHVREVEMNVLIGVCLCRLVLGGMWLVSGGKGLGSGPWVLLGLV